MWTRAGNFYPRPPRGGRPAILSESILERDNFYPRPPRGGRQGARSRAQGGRLISIHALREEGDATGDYLTLKAEISIHALREEGDTSSLWRARPTANFYPRPPRGGRPIEGDKTYENVKFLSTPSARRATPLCAGCKTTEKFLSTPSARRATAGHRGGRRRVGISIHALREEGDHPAPAQNTGRCNFYPRPPRGGRPSCASTKYWPLQFLSTPSARRATAPVILFFVVFWISIHALREEGDEPARHIGFCGKISIHALREEGDGLQPRDGADGHDFYPRPPRGGRLTRASWYSFRPQFLSTPSARRATLQDAQGPLKGGISIHALREEGDFAVIDVLHKKVLDFYPRPPRGGRPRAGHIAAHFGNISIHALREEGDSRPSAMLSPSYDFYPRPPRGGRPSFSGSLTSSTKISIHALREEGDPRTADSGSTGNDFYPRPPRGGRRGKYPFIYRGKEFLSTPSARRATLSSRPVVPSTCQFLSTPSARRATLSSRPVVPSTCQFLSTPSARRATFKMLKDH